MNQLCSFMGLAGYYRRFVPSYATVAAPLSDLLRKGSPNKLEWVACHCQVYRNTQNCLGCKQNINVKILLCSLLHNY